MPIRPENRARYPRDWKALSRSIREDRAGLRCECAGECGRGHDGRCTAIHAHPHPVTGSRVILTVAHLNHTPEDCDPANLRALCQACHLAYDSQHHAETRARTLREKRENGDQGGLW